jgi:hypothetical protein
VSVANINLTTVVVVQGSQEYFGEIFCGNCILRVADIDPLWAQCPSKEGPTTQLLLCDIEQKDINHLMKSIESNPHSAGCTP